MKKILSLLVVVFSAAAAELLPNGSFENNFGRWDYPSWQNKPMPGKIVTGEAFGGKKAFVMGLPGDKQNYIYTRLPLTPGKNYTLSFALRSENIRKGDLTVQIFCFGRNPANPERFSGKGYIDLGSKGGKMSLFTIDGTTPWKEYTFYIPAEKIPAGITHANLIINRTNNGQGKIWIDEVSLKEGRHTLSGSNNLHPNGSFENGLKNWHWPTWQKKTCPGKIVSNDVKEGKKAFQFEFKGDKNNYLFTSLPVKSGQCYTLRFSARTQALSPGSIAVRMYSYRKENGKLKGNGYVQLPLGSGSNTICTLPANSSWKEYAFYLDELSFPSDTCQANLLFQTDGSNTGNAAIDCVSWEVAPKRKAAAPATSASADLWQGDGSFEADSTPVNLQRVKTASAHGEYCVILPKTCKEYGFGYLFSVMTPGVRGYMQLWAKAAENTTLNVSFANEYYRGIGNRTLNLTRTWKRFVIPVNPSQGRSIYVNFKHPGNADIFLDAFCFSTGSPLAETFQAKPLSIGIVKSGEPREIYYTGKDAVKRQLTIRNNLKKTVQVKYRVTLQTTRDVTPGELCCKTVTLPPGGRLEKEFQVLPGREQGYYLLTLHAEADGEEFKFDAPFIITAPPRPITEDAMFGLHQGDYTGFRRIGMAQVRHFRNWSFWPRINGEFDTVYNGPTYFNLREPKTTWGMHHMETIFLATRPPWLKLKNRQEIPWKEMERYVTAIVSATKGISQWYEFDNEPHLNFPSQYGVNEDEAVKIHAEIVKCLAPKIKAINPDAKILAAGGGIRTEEHQKFVLDVMKLAGKNIDVLAVHPYAPSRYINSKYSDTGPDEINVYSRTLLLRKRCNELGYNPEIWYGEVGWALDVREDFLSVSALRHAAYVARLMLIAKAAGVPKVFYFLGDAHIEKEYFWYGLWRVGKPLPAALAYAASAQLLEGGKGVKVLSDTDTKVYTFRTPEGKLFAGVWLTGSRRAECTIKLDPSKISMRDFFNLPLKPSNGKILTFQADYRPIYIFADNVSEEEFLKALSLAKFDLPPLKVSWRLIGNDKVEITLENLRSQEFKGEYHFSGAGLSLKRAISVKPGKSLSFEIQLKQKNGKRPLKLVCSGELGRTESDFLVELLACQYYTPQGNELPVKGRLPDMANRDYLLPNDPGNGWDGPQNLSVKSALTYDKNNLYLAIDVKDDIQFQNRTPGDLWREDAIQLAIDTKADARPGVFNYDANDFEFGFGILNGKPVIEGTHIYYLGRKTALLNSVKHKAWRMGDTTHYRIAIPWKTLEIKPIKGTVFALNFTANDNDGGGARFYMGLTPGIVEGKNPYAFRKFILTD